MWYAQSTRAAPTATRTAAVSSARGPVGTDGTLDGLSSRRTTETGGPDVRIGKRTYELAQMGLQRAAWKLPTSAFGPSSWANVTRGGRYVTVITGPQGRCAITLPSAMRAGGIRAPARDGVCVSLQVTKVIFGCGHIRRLLSGY